MKNKVEKYKDNTNVTTQKEIVAEIGVQISKVHGLVMAAMRGPSVKVAPETLRKPSGTPPAATGATTPDSSSSSRPAAAASSLGRPKADMYAIVLASNHEDAEKTNAQFAGWGYDMPKPKSQSQPVNIK